MFVSSVIGLIVFWFWYFTIKYTRIQGLELSERAARGLGHVANLSMSLLLFPVTRNSIWEHVFGVPFERAIKYHRWAGVFFFIANAAHGIAWSVNW